MHARLLTSCLIFAGPLMSGLTMSMPCPLCCDGEKFKISCVLAANHPNKLVLRIWRRCSCGLFRGVCPDRALTRPPLLSCADLCTAAKVVVVSRSLLAMPSS